MITRVLILIVLLTFCFCKYFILGPAKVILMRAEDCHDVENVSLKSSFYIHMFNRTTQVLDINFSMPFDLDSSIAVKLKCSRLDRKQNPFTIEGQDACNTLATYVGELWADLETRLGIPQFCPIQKGFYSVKNLYLDLGLLKIKSILEGLFHTRVILKKGKMVLSCIDYDLKLEPKL